MVSQYPHPSVNPHADAPHAVHPSWYDSIETDKIAADLRRHRERLAEAQKEDTPTNRRRAYFAHAGIREFELVLAYRGITDVVTLADPVIVFDFDTMSGWLEVSK